MIRKKKSINWTLLSLYNPTSSDTTDPTTSSLNMLSCDSINFDHFLKLNSTVSHPKRTDPEIGFDRLWLYELACNSVNLIIGYQKKTVDNITIPQKVTQRIQNPFDKIQDTHFDLGWQSISSQWLKT